MHRAAWPTRQELASTDDSAESGELLGLAADLLAAIRRAKSEAKQSMRVPVAQLTLRGRAPDLATFALVSRDVRAAGVVREVNTAEADTPLTPEITLG